MPRRHRRPLLFPPGLLALGLLLLLGCGVVGRYTGRLKQYHVLQVTVPPLVPDSVYLRLASHVYMRPPELEHFRPWHTVIFTGNIWQDYFSLREAHTIARQLHDDPEHDRGLRVRFAEQATYASLVRSIDFFNVIGIRKYWLDMRQEPTTLYTFTSKPRAIPLYAEQGWVCGGMVLSEYKLPAAPAFTLPEQFLSLWSKLLTPGTWAPLANPDWRNSVYLLLLLVLASFGRLFWQWRRA